MDTTVEVGMSGMRIMIGKIKGDLTVPFLLIRFFYVDLAGHLNKLSFYVKIMKLLFYKFYTKFPSI